MNWKTASIISVIVLAAVFSSGMLVQKSCTGKEIVRIPGEIVHDTISGKPDTVYVIKTEKVYVRPTRPFSPAETSTDCCADLSECSDAYDRIALDYWHLTNVQASARKSLPWGNVRVDFSMTDYIQDPQTAFDIEATYAHQDSVTVVTKQREREWWERFGIHFGIYGGVDPFGKTFGATIGIGIGYEITGLF